MTMLTLIGRFLRGTRAGATAIAAATVTVMTVGGLALIVDHVWLVDQRDTLKSATDAAGIAATLEMARLLDQNSDISDSQLIDTLQTVAKRYIQINLSYLPADRFARATSTLEVEVTPDRDLRTVDVTAKADLGGTLLSKHISFLSVAAEKIRLRRVKVQAVAEQIVHPIEVVLAIDISQSMEYCVSGRSNRCTDAEAMRISIVKRAASKLVDILDPSADNQIAIGVVPWHMVVRLDDSARDEWTRNGWADYPKSRHYSATYSCGRRRSCPAPAADHDLPSPAPQEWQGCLDEHRLERVSGQASLLPAVDLLETPAQRPFAQAFFPAPYGTGYECLADPVPSGYALNFCYDSSSADLMQSSAPRQQTQQPPQYGCGDTLPTILPLTSGRARIDAAIDELDAVGKLTYSALGVLWGQRLLEHGWKSVWGDPVHPVDRDTNKETRKALVLLTDGDDTYCDLGSGQKRSCEDSAAGVDRVEACAAAKAAGTEIFVIAAMHPQLVSDHLAETLRACSSETQDSEGTYVFLNSSTPENLEAAFADIANQLSAVRRVY